MTARKQRNPIHRIPMYYRRAAFVKRLVQKSLESGNRRGSQALRTSLKAAARIAVHGLEGRAFAGCKKQPVMWRCPSPWMPGRRDLKNLPLRATFFAASGPTLGIQPWRCCRPKGARIRRNNGNCSTNNTRKIPAIRERIPGR